MGRYSLWKAEIAQPVPESDRASRTVDPNLCCGFWRISAARTKVSYPVAIWPQDGGSGGAIFFMIGVGAKDGQSMFDTVSNSERVEDFFHNGSWLKCSAVTEAEYHAAVESKHWEDGQPSRQMDDAEKLGVDVTTGGNNPPLDESLSDQIEAAASTAKALEVTDQTSADKATGILDKLRLLIRKAEAERVTEKAPILEEEKRIDAKWATVKAPGLESGEALEKRRKAWLKKEQDRLDAIAAAETKRRQDEARAEAQRIADEENARRALEAEQLGQVPAETVKAEEIEVPVVPVEAPRAKAGTAFGRASGLKKGRVGVITDKAKFIAAISGFPDFTEFLDAKVAKLAKANVLLDGMTIREELQ